MTNAEIREQVEKNPYAFACRETFTHLGGVWTSGGEGGWTSEAVYPGVVVFHDQQDSSTWAARRNGVQTGWYWAPEWALDILLLADGS